MRPDEVTTAPSGRSSLPGWASACPWSSPPLSMVLPGLVSPAATCASSLTGHRPRVDSRQMRPFRVRGPPQRLVVPRVADAVALALRLLGTHERQDDEEEYADDGEAEPQECLEHAHEAERTGSQAVACR